MINRLLAVSVVALTIVSGALGSGALGAHGTQTAHALPAQGVLSPGVSLGGLQIGETMAQVVQQWGHKYAICPKNVCKTNDTVWFYTYGQGEPLGGAVRFSKVGKVTAVFTLGSPPGWHTAEGVLVGGYVDDVTRIYGSLSWTVCQGYGAMSMRNSSAITSIYTTGDAVYGFALTAPGTPICQ